MKNLYFIQKHVVIPEMNLNYQLFYPDWNKYNINIFPIDKATLQSIHQLLQKIQQAGGNREELKKLTVKVGLWGPQFFDVPKNSDSIGTPKYPNQFISISSDGEQASIILNIDYPDAVIAFSHWGDTIGEGYDAETISLKDFIFLIDSWIKEDNLRSEQGYKYINPQNRQDFQEYKIEVTKTTLAELLKKIRLLNNSN